MTKTQPQLTHNLSPLAYTAVLLNAVGALVALVALTVGLLFGVWVMFAAAVAMLVLANVSVLGMAFANWLDQR